MEQYLVLCIRQPSVYEFATLGPMGLFVGHRATADSDQPAKQAYAIALWRPVYPLQWGGVDISMDTAGSERKPAAHATVLRQSGIR